MTDHPSTTHQPATRPAPEAPPAATAPAPPSGSPGYAADHTAARGFSPFDPRRKSPALASFLSLGPGLGQVYVGYYQRGFMHILIIAGTIALLASGDLPDALEPLLGIFLPFFWLYNIIDAGRRASLFNLALEGRDAGALPEDIELPRSGSMAGGLALIIAGVFFLMHTAFDWDFSWLEEWWPLFPIAFGVWLFGRGLMDRLGQPGDGQAGGDDRG